MKTNFFKIIIVFLISIHSFSFADDKVIKMGYKSIAKMPLIGENEDNSGLYLDLFNKAAKKIGYRLEIVRLPKKRLHVFLERGKIDFYPGSSFSQRRANYLYYLENGLETKEVLISLSNKNEITSMHQAKGILIVELGSSKIEWDKKYRNLDIIQLDKLSMNTVVNALKFDRGDFYIADIEVVNYFKKINEIKSYKELGLKIHNNAITGKLIPMHLGFSRKSKLFKEKNNPNYDKNRAISIENFPTIVDENSVAFKFYKALEELKEEEYTPKLYKKYFK